jgi:hypothetical protein
MSMERSMGRRYTWYAIVGVRDIIMLISSESLACGFLSMSRRYDYIHPSSVTAICVALFVYDYSLTLTREIDFIWFSRWNVIKVVFLMQRYLPFLDLVVVSFVGVWLLIFPSELISLNALAHRLLPTHSQFMSGSEWAGL